MTNICVDDTVIFKPYTLFGRPRTVPKGIDPNKQYTVKDVNYCLDGATSWDDLFFYEVEGQFCEFDFELVHRR